MPRLRMLTAGESHGPAVLVTAEGFPAGLAISRDEIATELARRRLGYGRSPRMDFEEDELELLGGVRHGRTLGSPIAVIIHNTEWPKWQNAMDPAPRDDVDEIRETGRGRRLTRPRPGHADLVGALKYGYDDVRNSLERASARETAARTVAGTVAKQLLGELGIGVLSHVVELGNVAVPEDAPRPGLDDLGDVDASEVRCFHAPTAQRMIKAIEAAYDELESLGGVIEVVAEGVPVGLGSHVHWDRKLDSRLAGACMSVQAMKGVEIGLGFRAARTPGSQAHDEIDYDPGSGYRRRTNRAGGTEAGISTGEPILLRVAMKPLSSLMQPLDTVDMATHEPAEAITQRSDVCAVPRAGVVLEAVVAFELADALLEKTGGDTLEEVRRNLEAYLDEVAGR